MPFLEGGSEKLFNNGTELLSNKNPDNALIFEFGHPDSKALTPPELLPPLDPKCSPLCVKTKHDGSTWEFAFERDSGEMTAAHGIVPSERVLSAPGRQVEIIEKLWWRFKDGKWAETTEVSFELPANSALRYGR